MLSTGNDIVSIAAINVTRTQDPVFYQRILSQTEILQYQQHYSLLIPFTNYVWLLWSIKESAYKYLQRFDPELLFSPTKFVVNELICPVSSLSNPFKRSIVEQMGFDDTTVHAARVTHGDNMLWSRSSFYPDMVHSVVNGSENFDQVNWGIKTISSTNAKSQSEAVRAFLLSKLQTAFNGKQMQIGKSEHGVPIILYKQEEMLLPISFSHHKHFVAYSFIAQ
jgi:phosphopantetheinyl transferase (holo-ACP synthase)